MAFMRPASLTATNVVHLCLLVVMTAVMASIAWTGFTASDDSYYVYAGRGWLHHFPYVSTFFGNMRELVNLPIAASIALLGDREFAMVLPSTLYLLATVVLTYFGLRGTVGAVWALVAGLLMLTVPLFILKATIPSADLALLFFATLTFWLFWRVIQGGAHRPFFLFATGFAAGSAFLSHELALALPVFFTVLFLIGFRLPRAEYLWILAGFLVLLGLNTAYYWAMTGDPIYRLRLMQEGQGLTVDRIKVPPFHFDDSGNFHIWAGIDPLVMLLTKQEFCLLFYFAIPAMVFVSWSRSGLAATEQKIQLLGRLLTLLVVVWGVFSAIVLMDAKLLPRYFMMPTWAAFLVMMLAATLLWRSGRRRLLLVLGLAFVSANLMAIALDNRNPRFAERSLAAFAQTTRERIRTDPMTLDKADLYLQWAGVPKGRVMALPPEPGGLYFYNPKNTREPNRLMPSADLPLYQPDPNWTKVLTVEEPPRFLARMMDEYGLGPYLPERIYRKIREPNPPVIIYRLDRVYANAVNGGNG